MNDRERLIELTAATKYCPSSETDEFYTCDECPYGKEDNCREAYIADSLISYGVTFERHGRWVGLEYDGYADGCPVYDLWECSECGEEKRGGEDVPDTHPYCPNCGAKMDEEEKCAE